MWSSLGGFSLRTLYISAVRWVSSGKRLARTAEENLTRSWAQRALFGIERRRRGTASANRSPSPYREGAEAE
jgi:hypothetical protein